MTVCPTDQVLVPSWAHLVYGQHADLVVSNWLIFRAGNPKGVVLTHKNVLATVAALQTFVREVGLDLGSDDSTLSYLTLAHILGRALSDLSHYQRRRRLNAPCTRRKPLHTNLFRV